MVAFQGIVYFTVKVQGDTRYENALAQLGKEVDKFRDIYGGIYIFVESKSREEVTMAFDFSGNAGNDG